MKKYTTAVVLFFVLLYSALGYAASLAYWQHEFPTLAKRDCRDDIAESIATNLFPVIGPTVTFFMTGFAEDGFQWTCESNR